MNAPIEAELVQPAQQPQPQTQALARVEQAQGGILDMPVEQFKGGLERRKQNRVALMDWIRSSMVEGIDFGRIHTVGKDKCRDGKNCKVDWHWSKPCLFKPGAERICGMLGMIVDFPTLKDYEQAAIKGIEIKTVILRCEICDAGGRIVGVGMGARSVAKDYGDVNKAIKMAEKSAHIDATLRMAGLSEIFTQDLDDPNGGKEPKTAKAAKPPAAAPAATQPEEEAGFDQARPAAEEPPKNRQNGTKATAETRARFLKELTAHFGEQNLDSLFEYAVKAGYILDTEDLPDWPLHWVPITKGQFSAYVSAIAAFMDGEPAEKAFTAPNPAPAPEPKHAAARKPVEVPRDVKPASAASDLPPDIAKQIVTVPTKGMKLAEYLKNPQTIGQLYAARHDDDQARRRLFGFMNDWTPTGWNGRPPRDSDLQFRAALDRLAEWLQENHPEEVSDQ